MCGAQLTVEAVTLNAEMGLVIYSHIQLDFEITGHIVASGSTRFAALPRWAGADRRSAGATASFACDVLMAVIVAIIALDQARSLSSPRRHFALAAISTTAPRQQLCTTAAASL